MMKDENENLPSGELLCNRAQKITEALYRVTDLFSEKEPLKWQLRDNAVELLDFLMVAEEKELIAAENISYSIRKMSRLLQLAYSSSAFISSINFEVLRREYLSLNDSFKNQLKRQKEELDSNGHSLISRFDSNGQHLLSNGHNGQSDKNELVPEKKPDIKADNNIDYKKDTIVLKERKRRILDLISAKGGSASGGKDNNANNSDKWLTIREISSSLPEFSPKSIQRDLLEMVDSGILKKIGDKRWRKYSFA